MNWRQLSSDLVTDATQLALRAAIALWGICLSFGLAYLAKELTARWQADSRKEPVGIFTCDCGRAARDYPLRYKEARALLMPPEQLNACIRTWRSRWSWIPEVDLAVMGEIHLLREAGYSARLEEAISRRRLLKRSCRFPGLFVTLEIELNLPLRQGVLYDYTRAAWETPSHERRQTASTRRRSDAAPPTTNLISELFESYCQWITGWQPRTTSLVVHAVVLIGMPTVMCLLAFLAGSREAGIQLLAAVAGALLAATLHVERWLPGTPVALAWVVTLSLVLLLIVPGVLPFFMARQKGAQRVLRVLFYSALVGLFMANLLQKGGR